MNRVNFNLLKNKITVLPAITSTPFKESLFKDKKVLITGGGTGLGKQMAKSLSVLVYFLIASRKEDVLKKTCEEIGSSKISYKTLDIRDHDSVSSFVTGLASVPDIVINNAAGNFVCPSKDLSYNGWNSILDIVLKGTGI